MNMAVSTIANTPTIPPATATTNPPTIAPTPTPTLPAIPGAACIPGNTRQYGTVIKVIDGDTIQVNMDGKNYSVRYIGIDSPETGQYYAAQAASMNNSLLGSQVLLIQDVSETDPYDRLLRYVISENLFINYELVKRGYAFAKDYPPDSACAATFNQAMSEARAAPLGYWIPTSTPVPVYVAPTASSGGSGKCHPSYPDVCIPYPPPDLDCGDIPYRRFRVLPPDPHNFDGDGDGIGCES